MNRDEPVRGMLRLIDGGAARPFRMAGSTSSIGAIRKRAGGTLIDELLDPLRETERQIDLLLAGEHGSLGDSQKEALRRAGEANEFLSSLLSLLSLTEREERGFVEPKEVFDLRFPVWDVADEHAHVARARRIRLDLSLPRDPIPVRGGRETVRTILRYTLREQIQATPFGGRIAVAGAKEGREAAVRFERLSRETRACADHHRAGFELIRSLLETRSGNLTVDASGREWTLRFPAGKNIESR